MSPRPRRTSTAQHHVEWLQLVDVSGPFLGLGVLAEVFPQGLDAVDPDIAERLKQANSEWQANREQRHPDAALDTAFVDFVLHEVLEYPDELTAVGAEIGEAYSTTLPEHRVTLRPDRALRRPGEPPKLLISAYPPDTLLGKPLDEPGLHASPVERMRILLSRTGVRSGLVTNGREWTLVHAPAERTASFVTWYTNLLVEERVTLRALRSLLGVQRLFGVDDPETLDGLFERSRDDEREVTDQLGYQARRAVELLVSAFDRADRDTNETLLQHVPEYRLYEATLAVVMRIIFLLAAEARGLFPDDGPWAESYALAPLRAELETQADRHGIEVLERRFDAWPRLLATFRAVHDGVEHSGVRMPGYGGGLFDPARYPFLDGAGGPVPRIRNRDVLHVLDALQTLEVEVPGGRERRPLSFRALGIEQIGHVYEGLLDHTAVRADAPALGLVGTKKKEPELALELVEEERAKGSDSLMELLKEETGRSVPALRRALESEASADRLARLRVACNHDAQLVERVLPFIGLVRDDVFGDPMVFREGNVYVTQSPFRRSTGTHYTPPSLTEPIVQYALEPLVYRGPAEGKPREDWELRSAAEILELKVCDIAMGSAAFLVAACRYLAARLVEAWELHDGDAPADAGGDLEERELTARRLVAERCLYGVDVNPLAVEIAKVSIWLTTLQRDRPFTFLDHALRCGDSLLGLIRVGQLEALSLRPKDEGSVLLDAAREAIRATLDEVRSVRERIEATDAVDLRQAGQKATALGSADRTLHGLKVVSNLVVGAAFEEAAGKNKAETTVEAAVEGIQEALDADSDGRRSALVASIEARAGDALMSGRAPLAADPPQPFHWALEFPEVLQRPISGFDAIVGNPPFLGGTRISEALGDAYNMMLAEYFPPFSRRVDLAAYFFRRAASLLRLGGAFGLLATNTISQGTTRRGGLDVMIENGVTITRARKSFAWPGEAAVFASAVWGYLGDWSGDRSADGVGCTNISTLLEPSETDAANPLRLAHNAGRAFNGSGMWGEEFFITAEQAELFLASDARNRDVVKRALGGRELNNSFEIDQEQLTIRAPRWILDFGEMDEGAARSYAQPFEYLEHALRPRRVVLDEKKYARIVKEWWKYFHSRLELYAGITELGLSRVLARARISDHSMYAFAETGIVYSDQLVVFLMDDLESFAALQSGLHDAWSRRYASTLKTDVRYIPTDCFGTFPLPDLGALRNVGERYYTLRTALMKDRSWGLTALYRHFHDPSVSDSDVESLRELQQEIDEALAAAYGWTDIDCRRSFRETPRGVRLTLSQDVTNRTLDRLLELNHARYTEEVGQGLHTKGAKKQKRSSRDRAAPTEQLEF